MKITHLDTPLSDTERSARLFAGELLIYTQRPAMLELLDLADQMLRTALGGLNPPQAQHQLTPQAFLQITGDVQAAFKRDKTRAAVIFRSVTAMRR